MEQSKIDWNNEYFSCHQEDCFCISITFGKALLHFNSLVVHD